MSEWDRVQLDDLCDAERGITYGIVKVGNYIASGVPVIRGGDIRDNRIVFDDEKRVSPEVSNQFRRTILRGGEIILNLIAEPGHNAVVPSEMVGFNVSRDVAVISLSSQSNHVFVNYFLKSPEAISWLEARLNGSVTQKINLRVLREVPVPLPPRSYQDSIAKILGALDDKIAVNDRIAEVAHSLAQAYVSRRHESAELAKLSEIADITMGSSPPGESYNEEGVGIPFYQGTRDFGDRFPGYRVWCTSPVRTASEASCLLSVRAPVGRVNIARERCCIGRGVAAVKSRQGASSVLFHELTAASHVWLPFEAEGTVFGAINKQQLSDIVLPVMDAASAHDLEEILRPLDQRVAIAYDENQSLARLRDALLPKLMSGEIRVRDAEKVVEDVT